MRESTTNKSTNNEPTHENRIAEIPPFAGQKRRRKETSPIIDEEDAPVTSPTLDKEET